MPLDLSADAVTLTRQLVDIESVSQHEQEIADAVEQALSTCSTTSPSHAAATPSSPAPTSAAASGW